MIIRIVRLARARVRVARVAVMAAVVVAVADVVATINDKRKKTAAEKTAIDIGIFRNN